MDKTQQSCQSESNYSNNQNANPINQRIGILDSSYTGDENSLIIVKKKLTRKGTFSTLNLNEGGERNKVNINIKQSKQSEFQTEEWIVQSNKNLQNNKNEDSVDPLKDVDNSIFKSMEESEEQSHIMERKLREENMQLRQEILHLKKALFMNNLTDDQSSVERVDQNLTVLSPQALSNSCLNLLISHQRTPDSDTIMPIMDVPKPYSKMPTRPVNSSRKDTTTDGCVNITNTTEYAFNINNKSMQDLYYAPGSQLITSSMMQKQFLEDQYLCKDIQEVPDENAFCTYDTNIKQRKQSIELLEQNTYEGKIPLRMRSSLDESYHKNACASQDQGRTESMQQISRISILMEDQEELSRLERMIEMENIHIKKEFLNEDHGDFEEKKRNSSVYEIKRHYENEIQALKRDLQVMQIEEMSLKDKLTQKNNSQTTSFQTVQTQEKVHGSNEKGGREFTFKNEALKKIHRYSPRKDISFTKLSSNQSSLLLTVNEEGSNQNKIKPTKFEKISAISVASSQHLKQSFKHKKKQYNTAKPSRYSSIDKEKDQSIQQIEKKVDEVFKPPQFLTNSSIDKGLGSPHKAINQGTSVFAALSPNDCQEPIKSNNLLDSNKGIIYFESFAKKQKEDSPKEAYQKSNLDTEFIDEIFENQGKNERFMCLDTIRNLEQFDGFNQESLQQTPNEKSLSNSNSFHESSFCYHINNKSGHSSIAVVQALGKTDSEEDEPLERNNFEQIKNSFNVKNTLSDMLGRRLSGLQQFQQTKPQVKVEFVSHLNEIQTKTKDHSPSFGGLKAWRNVYDCNLINSSQIDQAKAANSSMMSIKQSEYFSNQYSKCQLSGVNKESYQSAQINQSQSQKNSRPTSQNKTLQQKQQFTPSSTAQKRLEKIMKSMQCGHKKKPSQDNCQVSEIAKEFKTTFKKDSKQASLNSCSLQNAQKLERKTSSTFNGKQGQTHLMQQRQLNYQRTSQSPLLNSSQNSQLNQSKSQLYISRDNANTSISHQLQKPDSNTLKSKSQLKQSNEQTQEFQIQGVNQTNQTVDAEFFYELKNKSAKIKRTQILKSKENFQRRKLNEKMARIQEIQKQKQDKKQSFIETRLSKSPQKLGTVSNCSIMNYISLGQDQYSERLDSNPSQISGDLQYLTRNGLISKLEERQGLMQTMLSNTRSSNMTCQDYSTGFSNIKSYNPSMCTSRMTSNRATENNTPLTSSRRLYEASIEQNTSRDQINFYKSKSLLTPKPESNRKERGHESMIEIQSQVMNQTNTQNTDRSTVLNTSNKSSTANLFKKSVLSQTKSMLNQTTLSSQKNQRQHQKDQDQQISFISCQLKEKIQSTIQNKSPIQLISASKVSANQIRSNQRGNIKIPSSGLNSQISSNKNSVKRSMIESKSSQKLNSSIIVARHTTDIIRQYCSEYSSTQRQSLGSQEPKKGVNQQNTCYNQSKYQNKNGKVIGENKISVKGKLFNLEPIVEDQANNDM